ncbi:hypothetical protein C0995_004442 [Termitomyces sp. Mi166|nr:hypothetical protein C0995_004442 [Termitomyces sp. Mi166\
MRDEPGEEMSEFARVWKIYNDEASKIDSTLTEGWNRGIDVLLVFLMVPDTGDTTNVLLEKLISLQTNSEPVVTTPPGQLPSPIQVTWVNGLWFAALACSLSTALVSMLAKQWLQAYITNISGSPLQRARQRQSRHMELVLWHVPALINALPLLLHVALLLFFAGIVVLLWSVNLATTLATLLIVAFAYIFYLASVFISVIYPGCPYQHPLSEHIRKRIHLFSSFLLRSTHDDMGQIEDKAVLPQNRQINLRHDDKLDACALIWLLNTSTDKYVISAGLQAIAGLPRDFTAVHILRDAGVTKLIEQGFQACFDQDNTMGLQWHLMDAEGALLYCKAWINLIRGTSNQWPLELLDPLWKLQDTKDHVDGATIASCVIALSSIDSHIAQWELLAYISQYVSGDIQLSHCTVIWILDKDLPTSGVRSAAGLALYAFTHGGVIDPFDYRSEHQRRNTHSTVMLHALTTIAAVPERFGAGELLNIVAKELARLASPLISQSHCFSAELKEAACTSLFELVMSERVTVGLIPDSVLADVLHLLHQSRVPFTPSHCPAFVEILVKTLFASSHQGVASWSVRLLRSLLTECPMAVAYAFTENNGIQAVLRAARIGDIDNRRLQVDSWRSLFAFVDSAMSLHPATDQEPGYLAEALSEGNIVDKIFQSEFFETVCFAIVSHQWWLFEVSGRWTSTFVKLCRRRPHDLVWKKLIKVVRDMNEKHKGMLEILFQLESILSGVAKDCSSDSYEESLGDDLSMPTVTMAEQRLALRPTTSHQMMRVLRDGTFT